MVKPIASKARLRPRVLLQLNPRRLGSEEVTQLFRAHVFAEAGLLETTEWDRAVHQIVAVDRGRKIALFNAGLLAWAGPQS